MIYRVLSLVLYNCFLIIYRLTSYSYSVFNPKAEKWVKGRRNLFERLRKIEKGGQKLVWFHASSLGEFEQGRPVIEKLKASNPGVKVLLSFFSPSGYEICKNYESADYVFYLPLDGARNSSRFIEIVQPDLAVFIKYDFWYYFFRSLSRKGIPLIMVSSIFRKEQLFFKKWTGIYREILTSVHHFFVQDEDSCELLRSSGFMNYTRTGDTRIDRVFEIASKVNRNYFPEIEQFRAGRKILIVGSSHRQEEEFVATTFNNLDAKVILVPHHVDNENINRMLLLFKGIKTSLWSELNPEINLTDTEILIVDKIGVLVNLYQYADIAFIGGGFDTGIHSTLEPAAFGLPIIFGPENHHKFKEAVDLLNLGAARLIHTQAEFYREVNSMLNNPELRKTGTLSAEYIENQKGSSKIVSEYIEKLLKIRS